jgi:hypothetical protein
MIGRTIQDVAFVRRGKLLPNIATLFKISAVARLPLAEGRAVRSSACVSVANATFRIALGKELL